jgi:3-oxoacyl-[acyl-carrier protein] reductase
MDLGLVDKRVLVTGGGRGIGRAICLAFAREGARVAACSRTRADLEEVARAAGGAGGSCVPVVGDVSTEAGATRAVEEAAAALGGLDVLVNNAGGSKGAGSFDRASSAEWDAVLDLNLRAAVWCSRQALEEMKASGGVILHMSSVYGREYGPSAPYVAAKGALIPLTKEMGIDLARHGIRVCAVAPGSILFPGGSWDRRRQTDPERFEAVRNEIPWGRLGTAEEVADAIVFLASARASWITGVTLPVDGGQGRMP